MLKREKDQLVCYEIKEEINVVSVASIQSLFLERPSDTVYIIRNNILDGIICLGDIVHHTYNGMVQINRNYVQVIGCNVIKARRFFNKKKNVFRIPIVNEIGELCGEYSRWDDLPYIERNYKQIICRNIVKSALEKYEGVYVIKTDSNKDVYFQYLIEFLSKYQIRYQILNKEKVQENLSKNFICIFIDEEDKRSALCLLYCEMSEKKRKEDIEYNLRLDTFKNILFHIGAEYRGRKLKDLENSEKIFYSRRMDERPAIFLAALKKRGVNCFCLYANEDVETKYTHRLKREINERVQEHPPTIKGPWQDREYSKGFYDELYQLKDYSEEIAQNEINDSFLRFAWSEDIVGKYFNKRNGRRITCFQPEEYIGTIYCIGACTMVGYVEDQYTIESFLQQRLLEEGYAYRVENLGMYLEYFYGGVDERLQEIDKYNSNDIVIMQTNASVNGIPGISLESIYEKNNAPSSWFLDGYFHCNHKANKCIADGLFELIDPCLLKEITNKNTKEVDGDISDVMQEYINQMFLKNYFSDFFEEKYHTIGAIVMSGDIFTKGHLHLIEYAKSLVEFLIIFIIEEESFVFSFEERFKMVMQSVKDFEHIMVVPSGYFILSKANFKEYYTKIAGEEAVISAEYDINIFADYIAKPLHITHRFAGEEPEDKVKRIYNEAMRKILPQKGITFVEIPRLKIKNEFISASRVRKYIYYDKYDSATEMLPDRTKEYLF